MRCVQIVQRDRIPLIDEGFFFLSLLQRRRGGGHVVPIVILK